MMRAPYATRPPCLAVWLVDVFAPANRAESILGDFSEEFSDLVAKSGVAYARRWYWRQSVKTIANLASATFRVAPWWLTAFVLLGFSLSWFGARLPDDLVIALLRAQRPYSNRHMDAYLWLLTYGFSIARVLESLLIGTLVAVLAKGREMLATLTLAMLRGVSFIWLIFLINVQTPHRPTPHAQFQRLLFWHAVDLIGIVVAGVLVRKVRSISPPRQPLELRRHESA